MAYENSSIAATQLFNALSPEVSVSVVIPHYNDCENLKRCLGLLADQSLPSERFEIVVADNNSRCGIEEVQRVCGKIARVVPAPVQGAGPARNAAIAASRGTVLALVDSDCRPASNWLERGLAALSNHQIVGGRVDVEYHDPRHPTAVEAFERVFAFDFKRYVQKVGFSGTGNLFVRRDTFESVGPFRVDVAEDLDWGRRATAANFKFHYADDVVVAHPARRNWTELTQKWRKSTREAYAAAVETPNGRLHWFIRSFLILASPFVHWTTVLRTPKLKTNKERLMAVGVLFRIRFWRFLEANRLLLRDQFKQ